MIDFKDYISRDQGNADRTHVPINKGLVAKAKKLSLPGERRWETYQRIFIAGINAVIKNQDIAA